MRNPNLEMRCVRNDALSLAQVADARIAAVTVVHDNLDEENWDIRETFAFYGRAAYMASVLEVGLAHVLLHSQFMKQVRDEFVATKGKGFGRKAYEAAFDKFMDEQFAQTMGNLIKRLSAFASFDDELKARIVEAKKRRDFLTHGFWQDRSVEFATADGRAKMRDELMADAEMFGEVDRAVDAAAKSAREYLGIDDRVIEEYNERQMARLKAGLPWDDEPPQGRGS